MQIIRNTDYANLEFIFVLPGEKEKENLEWDVEGRRVCITWSSDKETPAWKNAYKNAGADLLLFLHEDLVPLHADWLDELVMWLEMEEIAAVSPMLINRDQRIAWGGSVIYEQKCTPIFYGHPLNKILITPFGQYDWLRNLSLLTPDCLLVSRKDFESSGTADCGLDKNGMAIFLSRKLRQNRKRLLLNPNARLQYRKHKELVKIGPLHEVYPDLFRPDEAPDPYLNPNVRVHKGQVQIKP